MGNPCGEIMLGNWDYVTPWVQVGMMETFGQFCYLSEERERIIKSLQEQIDVCRARDASVDGGN